MNEITQLIQAVTQLGGDITIVGLLLYMWQIERRRADNATERLVSHLERETSDEQK